MNKKVILATVATIAAVATAQGVKADELQGTTGTGNSTSGVTASQSGSIQNDQNTGAKTVEYSTTESGSTDQGSTSNDSNQSGNATQFTKNGSEIQVTNPNVKIEQPEGNGRYTPFKVKYEDIKIPDNIEVNEGDKVTFDLPQEVKFETSYEFDVHNPEKAVVGKATADPTANKVTTVFNDYFKSHPLNKSMNLELDASWSDKVVAGKPVNVNFNGTVVTANVGSAGVIGKDELITKWGSQDKEDPTVINWTARVNYAKRVLNYVTIIDEMSENQKLVDNYFEIKNIESLDPWIDKGSAMDLVKSISKKDHGFEITMDRLDHMIYLYYKTKLTNAVKDSTNPTNKIELKAEDAGSVAYQKIQLVGGRGDAVGEDKPVWEIPNDAPKYDKPSININDIPLMPPAPILDKPYLPIEDIPLLPPAPVLDKPELIIPSEPKKPNTPPVTPNDEPKPQPKSDKPNTPSEINSKPSKTTVEPQKEQVNVIYQVTQTNAHTLPRTGSESSLILSFAGMFILGGVARIALKREE